jgi:hypothetical protein
MFKDWTLQPYLQTPVLFTHFHVQGLDTSAISSNTCNLHSFPCLRTGLCSHIFKHLSSSLTSMFKVWTLQPYLQTPVFFTHFYGQGLDSSAISSNTCILHSLPCSRSGLFSHIFKHLYSSLTSMFKVWTIQPYLQSSELFTHFYLQGLNYAAISSNTCPLPLLPCSRTGLCSHILKHLSSSLSSSSTIGSSSFTHIFKHLASSPNNWPLHSLTSSST